MGATTTVSLYRVVGHEDLIRGPTGRRTCRAPKGEGAKGCRPSPSPKPHAKGALRHEAQKLVAASQPKVWSGLTAKKSKSMCYPLHKTLFFCYAFDTPHNHPLW